MAWDEVLKGMVEQYGFEKVEAWCEMCAEGAGSEHEATDYYETWRNVLLHDPRWLLGAHQNTDALTKKLIKECGRLVWTAYPYLEGFLDGDVDGSMISAMASVRLLIDQIAHLRGWSKEISDWSEDLAREGLHDIEKQS